MRQNNPGTPACRSQHRGRSNLARDLGNFIDPLKSLHRPQVKIPRGPVGQTACQRCERHTPPLGSEGTRRGPSVLQNPATHRSPSFISSKKGRLTTARWFTGRKVVLGQGGETEPTVSLDQIPGEGKAGRGRGPQTFQTQKKP